MRTKDFASILLRVAITVVLLWVVTHHVDLAEASASIAAVHVGLLAVAAGLMLLQTFVVAERWRQVLDAGGAKLALPQAVRLVFIGNFFNQFLVSAFGGDVVRMWLVRHQGITTVSAVTSVVVDRICALLAVLLLVVASAPWIHAVLAERFFWGAMFIASLGVAGAFAFAILARWSQFDANRWTRAFGSLPRHMAAVLLRAGHALRVCALAGISHLFSTCAAYAIANGLGASVTFVDLLAIFPWVILATALPVSVAGWGVREGAMVWGLSLVGVSEGHALALSLLFGLASLMAATPGALLWLAPRVGGARKQAR